MTKERVLISVKTYPLPSAKYGETVCTAGFREDGSWIRIYPVPYRRLDSSKQYKKYQWTELDLQKNPKDIRPESYRVNIDGINLMENLDTGKRRDWAERRKIIFKKEKVYTNLTEIIAGAHADKFSLVTFKPKEVLNIISTKIPEGQNRNRNYDAEQRLRQTSFLDNSQNINLMPEPIYEFRYIFKDDDGRESKLMIADWEINQLYWNCASNNSEEIAVEKVKQKYYDDFSKKKDLHFFLGTTLKFHRRRANNPYMIIGVLPLPFINKQGMF